eukprot:7241714-Pyramimonas_sp.AAC.1
MRLFGSADSPALKTRAGEAQGLFAWCATEALPKYADILEGGGALLACVRALHEWDTFLKDIQGDPDLHQQRRLQFLCARHLILLEGAGIPKKPKHH